MSTQRLPAERGWAPRQLPKGPNGRNLCRRCATEVPKGCVTFCSSTCVHEWKLRTQPAYQARHVLERDHGVCAICRVDTLAAKARLGELWRAARSERGGWSHWSPIEWMPVALRDFEVERQRLGWSLKRALSGNRPWDMDHIVPVAEGGGACGLDNLRTLCPACHARVTGELRARLAAAKRAARQPALLVEEGEKT